jgi:hypothetical protein
MEKFKASKYYLFNWMKVLMLATQLISWHL